MPAAPRATTIAARARASRRPRSSSTLRPMLTSVTDAPHRRIGAALSAHFRREISKRRKKTHRLRRLLAATKRSRQVTAARRAIAERGAMPCEKRHDSLAADFNE